MNHANTVDGQRIARLTDIAKKLLFAWWSAQSICIIEDDTHHVTVNSGFPSRVGGMRFVLTVDELHALGVL